MTPLDTACPQPFHELDAPARARALQRLADTEVFVALAAEPAGDRAELRMFEVGGAAMALCCDLEERLSGFFGAAVPYAAMPGRVLAAMLADEGAGLMVNPGATSEMMLDAATLGWLAEALSGRPAEEQAAPARLGAPAPQMVAALAEPLAERLGDMAGLCKGAALIRADWADGATGHLIVIAGAAEAARPAIAKAVAELLAFLPALPGPCDVAFDLAVPDDALFLRLERPAPPPQPQRAGPGMDPDRPPRLR
ncbi:MAG: SseB family protein [Paracoccus sp. (in: a-proteobacteria)]|nr:SseB family protein [Paracoccus sp. (in: a-proteobacteria)]